MQRNELPYFAGFGMTTLEGLGISNLERYDAIGSDTRVFIRDWGGLKAIKILTEGFSEEMSIEKVKYYQADTASVGEICRSKICPVVIGGYEWGWQVNTIKNVGLVDVGEGSIYVYTSSIGLAEPNLAVQIESSEYYNLHANEFDMATHRLNSYFRIYHYPLKVSVCRTNITPVFDGERGKLVITDIRERMINTREHRGFFAGLGKRN